MFANLQATVYGAFVASFCLLGLCLTFALPLYTLPDEPVHWLTANVRIERLLGREGCVPTVAGGPCPRGHACSPIPALELSCGEDIGIYGGLLTYPGVVLAKLILPRQTESAVRQVQAIVLSRLLHGLIIVLCLWRAGVLAQRTGRFGTLTLGALMLSPLLAQQAFAVSSDGAQIALGVCLFSALMFWDALGRADVLLFLVIGYATTGKPSSLPLVLPSVFAAHWLSQVENTRSSLLDSARSMLGALRPTRTPSVQTQMLWTALLVSALTVAYALLHDAANPDSAEATVARSQHLAELRGDPLRLLQLIREMRYDLFQAIHWVGPLGWLDLWVSRAVVNGFLRLLTLAAGFELARLLYRAYRESSMREGALQRLLRALPGFALGLLGPLANVLFMTALMYALWTPLQNRGVGGVQTRYFLPAAMVAIAVVWRTLQVALPVGLAPTTAPRSRFEPWLRWLAPCVVLALSMPYVARLFVDISLRYHDPAKYSAD